MYRQNSSLKFESNVREIIFFRTISPVCSNLVTVDSANAATCCPWFPRLRKMERETGVKKSDSSVRSIGELIKRMRVANDPARETGNVKIMKLDEVRKVCTRKCLYCIHTIHFRDGLHSYASTNGGLLFNSP